jgi:hypothetical protein
MVVAPPEPPMPTPYESARLNLQLFDLRRESVLREARSWFILEFNPQSFEEAMASLREHNTRFRMVISYWEMAASLVTTGAIDHAAFLAAHTEIVATFAKVHPYINELRSTLSEPKMLSHMEQVVLGMPDALATLERRRTSLAAAAKGRHEKQAAESR